MTGESVALALQRSSPPARVSTQLSRTAMGMLLAVALVSLAGLFWSTRQSDQISVERQARVARHSINMALDELALQQETVAVWDESAASMTSQKPKQQWLYDNIGLWLHGIFHHDETFLLDGADQPVQAVQEGKLVANSR